MKLEQYLNEKQVTWRQQTIAKLIVKGKSQKDIARILGLSVRTVQTYSKELSYKLGLSSTLEVAVTLVPLTLGGVNEIQN